MFRWTWSIVAVLALAGCSEDNDAVADPEEDVGVVFDGAVSAGDVGSDTEDAQAAATDGGGDARPATSDAAPLDPDAQVVDPCEETCSRVVDCAVEVCEGMPDPMEGCLEICAGNPSFSIVAAGIPVCAELVVYAGQNLPELASCNGDGPIEPGDDPVCAVFGERVASCLGDRCAAAADQVDGFTVFYTFVCNSEVANGNLNLDELGAFINEATPCEAPALANIITNIINGDPERPDDRGLGQRYCEEGPDPSVAVCAASCDVLAPCIPEDGENAFLRDTELCTQFCAINGGENGEAWTCAGGVQSCEEAFACFQPPRIEACGTLAGLLSRCLPERCAPAGEITDGLTMVFDDECQGRARSGEIPAEALEALDPAGPCDQELVATLIDDLIREPVEDQEVGSFQSFCVDGPLVPADRCVAACANVGPCIGPMDDGAALRDPAVCAYFCALDPTVPPETWQCMEAAVGGCGAVGQCFEE